MLAMYVLKTGHPDFGHFWIFRNVGFQKCAVNSECPKSEHSVWETEQKMVRFSDVLISDVWAVRFVRFVQFKKLDQTICTKNFLYSLHGLD